MTTLRPVGVISSVRLLTVGMAALGLMAGMAYSFGGAGFDVLVSVGWVESPSSGAWSTPGVGWGTALAFLALIGMPLIFAACGLVAGAVGAILYNVVIRTLRSLGGWSRRRDKPLRPKEWSKG